MQVEAGETLKLEVLDASKSPKLSIADARARYLAVTTPRGAKRYYQTTGSSGSIRFESETRFEGEDAVTTYRGVPNGDKVERQPVLERAGTWTYSSYLCR